MPPEVRREDAVGCEVCHRAVVVRVATIRPTQRRRQYAKSHVGSDSSHRLLPSPVPLPASQTMPCIIAQTGTMQHSGSEFVCEEQRATSQDRNRLDGFTTIRPLNCAAIKWTLQLVPESRRAHPLSMWSTGEKPDHDRGTCASDRPQHCRWLGLPHSRSLLSCWWHFPWLEKPSLQNHPRCAIMNWMAYTRGLKRTAGRPWAGVPASTAPGW